MAHLCMTKEEELTMLPLGRTDSVEIRERDHEYHFLSRPARPTRIQPSSERPDRRIVLIPWQEADRLHWALVCSRSAGVSINGVPVSHGLQILADRDTISMSGGVSPLFFLDEDPARIEAFPGGKAAVKCGRCKTPITKGNNAIRCPGCGTWHHEGMKKCWTYGKTCPVCQHSTSLDGAFSWTPAGL